MTPEPFYKPMKPGMRIFWTLVGLASFAFLIGSYSHYLAR